VCFVRLGVCKSSLNTKSQKNVSRSLQEIIAATNSDSGSFGSQFHALNIIIPSFPLENPVALANTEMHIEFTEVPARALKGRQLSSVLKNDQIYLNWHNPVHCILNWCQKVTGIASTSYIRDTCFCHLLLGLSTAEWKAGSRGQRIS